MREKNVPRGYFALSAAPLRGFPESQGMRCVGLMKRLTSLNRWIALALLIALVGTMLPAVSVGEETLYGYVTIKTDLKNRVVNFRRAPNTNDDTNYPIARLPEFWVVELLEKQTVTKNGVTWYHICANVNLDGGPAQKEEGDVMASFITVMTAEEQAAWQANPADTFQPAPQPTPTYNICVSQPPTPPPTPFWVNDYVTPPPQPTATPARFCA